MERILILGTVAGLAALGSLMIFPAALAAGPSADRQGYAPLDRPAQAVRTHALAPRPGDTITPGCVMDSSLFTGRDGPVRPPDKPPTIGTFRCTT
jgi:hypothetical protein